MKKMSNITLIVVAVTVIVTTILMINKSRLNANTDRVIEKPSTVAVATAVKLQTELQLSFVGVLQANSDVPAIAETQGKILECYVDVGDRVNAGQPIVKVDTLLKYAAFIAAKSALGKVESDLERFTNLYRQGNLSSNELELAELNCRSAEAQYLVAKRQFEDAVVCAPISGEVAEKNVAIGMMVVPGTPVATIIDISRLKVVVAVSENNITRIMKGMKVSVAVETYPGVLFTGTVKYTGPKANESLFFPIEVVVINDQSHRLKAGMTAHVTIRETASTNTLLVPRIALIGSTHEGKIFVVENSLARIRSVVVGKEYGANIEILSGLSEGDTVVTVGKNTIRNGVPVTVTR
jgi:RND family efflux transporter MFP subunit